MKKFGKMICKSRKTISLILAVMMALSLFGCSGDSKTIVNEKMIDALSYDENKNIWTSEKEEYEPVINLMKKECDKEGVTGTYLLATDDDIIFVGGIDALEIDGKTKVNAFTTYEIGSLTKMITAAAILKLCEEGKISLDDKVTDYFPDYSKAEDITIYHLLHMQSGIIREFIPDDALASDFEVMKKYYSDGYSDEELLSMLYEQDLLFAPGSQKAYSNTNYSLLAMMIEQVTGESYADYVKKTIFEPNKMTHSSSMTTGDVTSVPKEIPEGFYDFDVKEIVPTGYVNTPNSWRGCGDIHSCAADLLIFDRALFAGKIINEDSMGKMFDMDKDYGCGWYIDPHLKNAYVHTGGTPNFAAINICFTDTEFGNLYFIELKPTVEGGDIDAQIVENLNTILKLN